MFKKILYITVSLLRVSVQSLLNIMVTKCVTKYVSTNLKS